MSYFLNNVLESKALLPLVAVENDVSVFDADLLIIVTFVRYGGICEQNGYCKDEIKVNPVNISPSLNTKTCEMDDMNNCIVTYHCQSCEINTGAEVEFVLTEDLSYCSSITVNITTSSSIPNEISSKLMTVTSSTSKVLRGYSPTKFYFSLIPSLFKSSIATWPSQLTGYHVDVEQSPIIGSEFFTYELPFSSNLNLGVVLNKSSNCLYTIRSANTT